MHLRLWNWCWWCCSQNGLPNMHCDRVSQSRIGRCQPTFEFCLWIWCLEDDRCTVDPDWCRPSVEQETWSLHWQCSRSARCSQYICWDKNAPSIDNHFPWWVSFLLATTAVSMTPKQVRNDKRHKMQQLWCYICMCVLNLPNQNCHSAWFTANTLLKQAQAKALKKQFSSMYKQ